MQYSKIPSIYKMFVTESDLLELYDRDWYETEELDEEGHDTIAEYLAAQFRPVVNSIDLDGPDDFMLSAYLEAGPWASEKHKDETVTMKLKGRFQFCVYGCERYGKNAFKLLRKVLESSKFKLFTISELHQPEDTPGISFNGIYQTEDMIYISGNYEFNEVVVDVEVPTNKKFLVDIRPFDSNYLSYQTKIEAPANSSEEDLHNIVVTKYEDKLLKLVTWEDIKFKDYEDSYFECDVTISFDGMPYKIYLDNETSENLRYNDDTSARMCAWKQFLEDLEVEDVSYLED